MLDGILISLELPQYKMLGIVIGELLVRSLSSNSH